MNYKISAFFLIFLMTSVTLWSQTKDFGIWSSVGMDKKLGKWNIGAEGELRTKDNSTEVNRWSLQLEASYRIIKLIQVGAGYEYIYFHDTRYLDFQPRNRSYAFVQGKYKIGDLTFSLRERLQVTKKDDSDRIKKNGEINTYQINPEWTWRNRLKISYDIPKFPVTPALSFETFYQLNNPDGNVFNKIRYSLSFSYNLTKHHQFEMYGLIDKQINESSRVTTNILGFRYNYSF
jgi:hypothetical protein